MSLTPPPPACSVFDGALCPRDRASKTASLSRNDEVGIFRASSSSEICLDSAWSFAHSSNRQAKSAASVMRCFASFEVAPSLFVTPAPQLVLAASAFTGRRFWARRHST